MSRLTNKTALRRISAKRLAELGGQMPRSSIVPKPGATTKKKRPRPKAETERAHGPVAFRAWTKAQPCIVPGCVAQPCDAAHVKSGGTGRKDDFQRTVALCSNRPAEGYRGHHEQYDHAKQSFPREHGLDMLAESAAHYARWLAHCGLSPSGVSE